jgi:hypothetical protein
MRHLAGTSSVAVRLCGEWLKHHTHYIHCALRTSNGKVCQQPLCLRNEYLPGNQSIERRSDARRMKRALNVLPNQICHFWLTSWCKVARLETGLALGQRAPVQT